MQLNEPFIVSFNIIIMIVISIIIIARLITRVWA